MTHQIKYNSFTSRVVYLTMSADQNSISDSVTTVQFDTVTGDSGHGVSISSNPAYDFTSWTHNVKSLPILQIIKT